MPIEGFIQLTGLIKPADDGKAGYVASCPELKLGAQGKTVDETIENLREVLVDCMTFLNGEDELVDVLHWRGVPVFEQPPIEDRNASADPDTLVHHMVAELGRLSVKIAG